MFRYPLFIIPAKLLVSDQYFVTHMRECLVNLYTHYIYSDRIFRLQFLSERTKNELSLHVTGVPCSCFFFYVYGVLAHDFEVSSPGL